MSRRPNQTTYRFILYLAVCVLVLGTPRGLSSLGIPAVAETAAIYLGVGAAGILFQQLVGRSRPSLWPVTAALDVGAQAFVIARMGGPESVYLLLLALPILVWGLYQGIRGGAAVAVAGAVADVCLLWLRGGTGSWLGARGGLPAGMPPAVAFYQAFGLLLLGAFAGLLGRRIRQTEAQHEETCRELEQAQLDAESIINRLSRGLLCLDREGRISRLNARAENLLGSAGAPEAPCGSWVGRSLAELAADGPLVALARHLTDRLGASSEETHEVLLDPAAPIPEGRDEGRALEVTTTPVLDHEGNPHGLVVLLSDQTPHRAREAERRRRERLVLIGELSAGLAHEIRNSLKPITGSVELLRDEISAGDPSRDALMEIILRESESLENFLTEFLNFARDKNLEMEVLPLERVLGEEFESLNALPDGPFTLSRPAPGENLLWVRADRGALRSVVRNLGLNALEAGGGRITLGWRREGSQAVVFVRDHGPGIPESIRSKVFDPFFTTKPGGTGLGLAIARDLTDRLGGVMILEPAAGGGTIACVRLPLVAVPGPGQGEGPEGAAEAA